MKRVMLIVAYDGTNYHGWQMQPNAVTIEQILNEKLSELLKEDIQVIGASRTDAGVHAVGNVAVFDTESRIPGDKICFALNQRLPDDVRIQASEEVPLTFHPRKANCVKTYEYKILNRKIDMPLQRLYSHFCYFNYKWYESNPFHFTCRCGWYDSRCCNRLDSYKIEDSCIVSWYLNNDCFIFH